MKNYLALVLFALILSGCLEKDEPQISYEKYKEQGEMMINITDKLARETDADQLNKAARGIELARVVACQHLLDECDMYGKFLSEAIELSSDRKLSFDDITTLQSHQKDLRREIERGYTHFEKK